MNSDTPRTDAALIDNADLSDWGSGKSNLVSADFARSLERELNDTKKHAAGLDAFIETVERERDEWRKMAEDIAVHLGCKACLNQAEEQFLARFNALKSNNPLDPQPE